MAICVCELRCEEYKTNISYKRAKCHGKLEGREKIIIGVFEMKIGKWNHTRMTFWKSLIFKS